MNPEDIQDVGPEEFPMYTNEPKQASEALPQGSGSKTDSDTVDGFQAVSSSKSGPNKLVATDSSGTLPTAIIPSASVSGQAKAWTHFHLNSGSMVAGDSFGVSTAVRNTTGVATITWSTAFSSANYIVVACGGGVGPVRSFPYVQAQSTTAVTVAWDNGAGTTVDAEFCSVIAFGDQ